MDKLTNIHQLPLSMAVFLAHDDYDGVSNTNTISATSLLKSTKQYVLTQRVSNDTLTDISTLISARMGSAYHAAVEAAWKSDNLLERLQALGVPKRVRERIRVNPEETNDEIIPVYMEQRTSKKFMGWEISGKFDLIVNGTLEDIKSTSVFTYINQLNKDKYVLQGSIYRWLNPDLVTDDYMQINYIFTDWSANQAKNTKGYPPTKIYAQKFQLLSIKETEQYIKNKLRALNRHMNDDEDDIPPCTDEELWRKDPVWKYYSKPSATRSSKNFDNPYEAAQHLSEKGKGIIKEVKGEVVACKYCAAFNLCRQKNEYLQSGDLKL